MGRSMPDRSRILSCLREESRGMHVAEVASRLRVPASSRRRLLQQLEELAATADVRGLPGQRFKATSPTVGRAAEGRGASSRPTPDLGSWEGVFSSNPRGFGFVNALGQDDVYVPPPAVGTAMHGDTVQVVVVARSARGLEGRVARVVHRRPARVCGVLRRRSKSVWLEPDDDRIRGPILISTRAGDGKDGDAAVVNVTGFPEGPDDNPVGEVVAVLGTPGDPEVEIAKILARDDISEEHDPAALKQAAQRAAELTPVSLKGRKDFRKVPLLTIDPVDARDHDDAIFVERRDDGYRAYIAIADVSEYVQAASAVDLEASKRCFTTYLPTRSVPMLPAILASDHCSLLPQQDRYCLCAVVDLDATAHVKRFRLLEGVAHVAARLSYGEVAATLGFTESAPGDDPAKPYKAQLRVLAELARKLRRARMARGALDLDLPEPKVEVEPDGGRPITVTRRAKDPGIRKAYQMVEEMMLLANERVARWLGGRRSPAVYRVHGAPDPERLEQLGKAAKVLGAPFDADVLSEPLGVSRWLTKIEKHPAKLVLEGLLLRSLKMAQYDTTNIGHFGLASDAYVHFTSPIRRYPDLLVHRLSKALLRGGEAQTSDEALDALQTRASRASDTERVVMHAEREVVDVYRCLLMQDRVGEVYEGRVTGLAGSGLYVALDEPFVDVLVRFESLGTDRYEASDDGLSVHSQRSGDRVSLGDRLVVVIEDVVLSRRTVYGRRVGPKGPGSASSKASASPRGRRETGSPRGRREAAPAEKPARSGGQRRSQAGTASGPAGRGQRRGGPGRSR